MNQKIDKNAPQSEPLTAPHRAGQVIHMRSSFIRTAHANDPNEQLPNLKEELIKRAQQNGEKQKNLQI